jgi:hypothetical protein
MGVSAGPVVGLALNSDLDKVGKALDKLPADGKKLGQSSKASPVQALLFPERILGNYQELVAWYLRDFEYKGFAYHGDGEEAFGIR